MLAAFSLLLAPSCRKVDPDAPVTPGQEVEEGVGTLHVDIGFAGALTKAVTPTDGEKTINALRVYVFDADGMMDLSHDCTSAEITAMTLDLEVKTGAKTVVAVANLRYGPLTDADGIMTLSALRAIPSDLSTEGLTNLIMYGEKEVVVTVGGANTVSVGMVRRCGRVFLHSVKNALPAAYGSFTIKRAFLCDVYARTFLGGPDTDLGGQWYNTAATCDDGSFHVLYSDAAYKCRNAVVESTTVRQLNETVTNGGTYTSTGLFFYGYQNPRTERNNGWFTPYVPKATTLMVVIAIAGKDYYYPVSLTGGFMANTAYDVDLTVAGLGNTVDNAYDRIDKVTLTVSLSVADWESGTPVNYEL